MSRKKKGEAANIGKRGGSAPAADAVGARRQAVDVGDVSTLRASESAAAGCPARTPMPPAWAAAIPVLLPLAMYVYTAAPSVTLVDSGEFATVCRTLGIGHPPGVPTYVILGHLFSLLPLSADIARRTNLFSAVCAALCAGISYPLTKRLLPSLDARLALAGSIAFGFSLTLWSWAVITEVYALNTLLLMITLWFAARGRWIATSFAAGLALGVHHATILMALPAVAVLLWDRARPTVRDLALSAASGATGLSVYLYLPLRAMQDPILNWGDPRTVERILWEVSGRQYASNLLSTGGMASRAGTFFDLWIRQTTPLGFALVAIGLVVLARKHRAVFLVTSLLIGLNVAFVLLNNLGGPDIGGYHMPAFLAGAWCFAVGADALLRWLPGATASGQARLWAVVLIFLIALIPVAVNFSDNDHHDDRVGWLYVENAMRGLPQSSLIITSDWEFSSPWMYRHFVEGQRPDVVVIDTILLRASWYLHFLERNFPDLTHASAAEIVEYRRLLDLHEHRQPEDVQALSRAYHAVVDKFVEVTRARGGAVFRTLHLDNDFVSKEEVAPHGILYVYAPAATEIELDLSGLQASAAEGSALLKLKRIYASMIVARAIYAANQGDRAGERLKLETALRIDPQNEQARRMVLAVQ